MSPIEAIPPSVAGILLSVLAVLAPPAHRPAVRAAAVSAQLSEWKVELSEGRIAAGTVTFTIKNVGSIPHAFEVEGKGIEKETPVIQPGASATLTLTLRPGSYEVYCPVGEDSHKMLGMTTRLTVTGAASPAAAATAAATERAHDMVMSGAPASAPTVRAIQVTGGGPVIQILPVHSPFPTARLRFWRSSAMRRRGWSRR